MPYGPSVLHPDTYLDVARSMLEQTQSAASGIRAITPDSSLYEVHDPFRDRSFMRQLPDAVFNGSSIHNETVAEPEIIAVTAVSAIPIAAAVRGFYKALGKTPPVITYILANRRSSRLYELTETLDEAETARLHTIADGMNHGCIIDQYSDKGMTLTYAGKLMLAAGVRHVTGIGGNWYDEVTSGRNAKLDPVKSRHDSFMRSIGIEVARHFTEAHTP